MTARFGFAIALLVLASSAALAATPLDDLIKPEPDAAACFIRVYDAAHLRAHPKQKITAMTVQLRYGPPGGGTPSVVLSVSLGIVQRGDPDALYSDGGCDWEANRDTSDRRLIKTYPKEEGFVCMQSAQPDVFESTSAEEGGNLILDRGKDRDTLMVYLGDSLTLVKRAARRNHLFVRFGADDRVFMLRRTDMKDCSAVEDAVSTPEPEVTPRQR